MKKIARALISVSDKTGVVEFAGRLAGQGVELISTGGTAAMLRAAGLAVRDIADLTGFPEILGGRVKTLHPKVHGGILAIRDSEEHQRQVAENGIEALDMVVVNLYPFGETVARAQVTAAEAIENIDIGGPSMIRSAAKNFHDVAVVTAADDYAAIGDEMEASGGSLSLATRFALAQKAFATTAQYDAMIAAFLADAMRLDAESQSLQVEKSGELPSRLSLLARQAMSLRYGENPHQRAALYVTEGAGQGIADAAQLQGKELSFNNLIDLEAAWSLAADFSETACCIIKHTNPCGAALGAAGKEGVKEAFEKARATDPVSAFGGIIGFNRTVTEAAAQVIVETFFEAIVAPDYEAGALAVFAAKKNLRVMRVGADAGRPQGQLDIRSLSGGGLLVQERDAALLDEAKLRVVSRRQPSQAEMRALRFAWVLCKHVKSNAIVYACEGQLVGVGAGQMSRVDSVRIGKMKAQLPLAGTVLASDAFFPFRDGVDEAAKAGITAIIQPGGSVRDEEVIAAADEHNIAMLLTGIRHFKH